jgi:hypothetical protein
MSTDVRKAIEKTPTSALVRKMPKKMVDIEPMAKVRIDIQRRGIQLSRRLAVENSGSTLLKFFAAALFQTESPKIVANATPTT